jgi:hypothetical protein
MRCQALLLFLLAALGCAHTREPYSYLPPLAPPVYPQPQDPARPAVQPAPPPVSGAPVAMLPGPMAGPIPGSMPGVVAAGGDPCCQPTACEGVQPVVYEADAAVPCCP